MRLSCVILEDGTVANCSVECTAGWDIDDSALLMVQNKWRYEPGLLNGQPVPVRAKIEVGIRLY